MNKTVAVTGANGFIASVIVKTLLGKGYTVVGIVRDPSNEDKVAHLKSLPNSQNLKLVKGSFEEQQNNFISAFEGVECVFHTANPVTFSGNEEELAGIPIKGAEKILQAIEANKNTIKSLIYTSSIAACMSMTEPWSKNVWSDMESCKNDDFWYAVGKTQAERISMEYCRNNSINFSSILPCVVQGEVVSKNNLNFSLNACVVKIIKGDDYSIGPILCHHIVDVQDVADMHINAYEKEVKEGRFLAIGDTFDMNQYSTTLKRVCQEEGIDEKVIIKEALPENEVFKHNWIGKEESVELLGRQFNNLESTVRKSVKSIKGIYI